MIVFLYLSSFSDLNIITEADLDKILYKRKFINILKHLIFGKYYSFMSLIFQNQNVFNELDSLSKSID
jgi:hypothetical protein